MTEVAIRKLWSCVDETSAVHGDDGGPLRKVAACAVIANPFAGRGYVEDLSGAFELSVGLGEQLGTLCRSLLEGAVQSYGKAGIAGSEGRQEHVNAFLTSSFGNSFRDAVGGGKAWITSTTKVAGIGAAIDVPLAYKDEIWVRSHYDTLTVTVPDGPRADELVVIAAVANRGRISARVGGMTVADAQQSSSRPSDSQEIR